MGVKNFIKKAGMKAADKIAGASALSPEQLQKVQEQRELYLSEMPDPTDSVAEELTKRLLAASAVEIYDAYLPQIKDLYAPVQKVAEYDDAFHPAYNIRYFNITKWVTDKRENSLEKLVNVYAVLSNEECNIALVFYRTCNNTEVYLAVTNTQNADNNYRSDNYKQRLEDAVRGNFPGAEWKLEGKGTLPFMDEIEGLSVASASNIPTEKSEKFVSQTIEKLLDGIVPDTSEKEYTIILLATPIQDVEERKLRLGEIYSGLAPYAGWSTNFTFRDDDTVSSSATIGVNAGVSAGIQNGQNQSMMRSEAQTDSENRTDTDSANQTETDSTTDTVSSSTGNTESESLTHTDGTSETHTDSKGSSDTVGGFASASGGVKPLGVGAEGTVGGSYSHGWNRGTSDATGKNVSDAATKGTAKTITESMAEATGHAVANSVGKSVANSLGRAVTNTAAKTVGTFKSVSLGGNFGVNFARTSNVSATVGKSEGINQTYTNYNIKHALELLEDQMKRYEQSTALGLWDFAAYVLSESQNVANNVAHSYLALTQGEESYLSHSAVNLWRGDMGEESNDAKEICSYLQELRHPVFGLNPAVVELSPTFNVYPPIVTATTSLSGKELAYSLNFPQKSISGLPVLECAEFGRNVITYEDSIAGEENVELGYIFHMNHKEHNRVVLSKRSLASHTFITGSTGSGKSNTIYQMLEEARALNAKFLVVEPAKGEYKHVFGNDEEVSVYGTNPMITPLLKINPFSFPKEIHVLEHLDRLIEIFNVCWPMYAAMPAVLKNAIEKSYIDAGWDLKSSINRYDQNLYPTFLDVARNIKTIIDSSEYDTENKGAYKGSLLTRLQSLTNGINGMIFVNDELSDRELFDENVIIDLSRVGSTETKSLIMGMLVLKLQEYRMASSQGMNMDFRHITVLEEAHNLLRRTSSVQSSDSSNLLGKSVEMLANAIAEMRTYGEGFIIADQAPGLMDMSVIRNTNTKIIMRLPDQTDRELVGKAANLNEDQITELAKLPCGVAAVYQNEWVMPVLCKIDWFEIPKKMYDYTPGNQVFQDDHTEQISESLLDCIMKKEIFRKGNRIDIQKLKDKIIKSKLPSNVKVDFMEYVEKEPSIESLRKLLYDFLSAEEAIKAVQKCNDLSEWAQNVVERLDPSVKPYSKKQIHLALALVLYEQTVRDVTYNELFVRYTEAYQSEGGVF